MRWPWKPLTEAPRPLGPNHMDFHWDIKGLGTLRYTYFVKKDPRPLEKLYTLVMSSALTNWIRWPKTLNLWIHGICSKRNLAKTGSHLDCTWMLSKLSIKFIHTASSRLKKKSISIRNNVHVAIICKNKLLRLFASFITLIMRGSSAGSRGKQLWGILILYWTHLLALFFTLRDGLMSALKLPPTSTMQLVFETDHH